jgi:hypothetical protein
MVPENETLERAAEDKAEGKSPSIQTGELVREEIEHVREGNTVHGQRSKQSQFVTINNTTNLVSHMLLRCALEEQLRQPRR